MDIRLKICGMKHNVAAVAALQPDYLGFIFYDKSKRYFEGREIPVFKGIQKVGVFVDASIEFIIRQVEKYALDVIQLHGDESPGFCRELKEKCLVERSRNLNHIEIWNVFSIKDSFDFSVLSEYEPLVSKFLFDTKGKEKGGNGYTFDWSVLKEYPGKKPFILSGGIGLDNISEVKKMLETNLPLYAIDVNSQFEDAPGLKNIEDLKKLKEELTK